MLRKLSLLFIAVLTAAVLTFFAVCGAGAAEDGYDDNQDAAVSDLPADGDSGEQNSSVETNPLPTEPFTEYREPVTEPTEPVTEWAPAVVETLPPEDYGAIRDEYNALVESAEEETGLNNVKMDKSISNKTYTTDNIAGIVSWICVAVGLVVVLVMLVSTKAAGRGAAQGK